MYYSRGGVSSYVEIEQEIQKGYKISEVGNDSERLPDNRASVLVTFHVLGMDAWIHGLDIDLPSLITCVLTHIGKGMSE